LSDTVEKTGNGAILYDSSIINQISDAEFVPGNWSTATLVKGVLRSAGRGNTAIVADGLREFVLRHYVRGGVPGRIVFDRYLWTGEDSTRSFSEWRLLAKLVARDLPVPRPVAARYCRTGLFYRADLLTVRIPGIRSLADRIAAGPGSENFWHDIGRGLHRFHDAGVYHADLNAYNVQVDDHDHPYLLDFDRGRIRAPGVWRQKNLARLHRSLRKVKLLDERLHYTEANWNWLLDGYFNESRSA
jgi:3-deoxy-D-manno-octulosonic acid kinase